MSVVEVALAVGSALLAIPAVVFTLQCLAGSLLPDRRRAAHGETPGRTVVMIPAHDEELGIVGTVACLTEAVREGLGGRGEVLVIADNCTDATAKLAEQAGARVLERVDPDRRGKGFAISYGAEALSEAAPDVVVLVDADCRITPASLRHLAQFAWSCGQPVQADYILAPPTNPSPTSGISGLAVLVKNRVRPRGMRALGMPCQLTGSGMAMPYAVLRDAPETEGNIVEDMVLGVELALRGSWPRSTSQAEVRSELPAQRDAATGQRRRWEHGHLATMLSHAPRLLLRGLTGCSPRLVAMGLDLTVPPMALLVVALLAWSAVCSTVFFADAAVWPFWLAVSAFASVALGTLVAWGVHGRQTLPLRHLLCVPLYVAWKIPLYVAFFAKRGQRSWNRTARSSSE